MTVCLFVPKVPCLGVIAPSLHTLGNGVSTLLGCFFNDLRAGKGSEVSHG